MAKSKLRAPARQPGSSPHAYDPIRIVPLHFPGALAAAAAAAQLTYRNGPLISAVDVFTIFWGGGWKQGTPSSLVGQLNSFFDIILTSALIDQLTEYNVPKYTITHGRRIGTARSRRPRLDRL